MNPTETATPTLDRISAIVREILDDDGLELGLETRPRDIDGWDSLAHISIVFSVEESFGACLGTDILVTIETVGDLVRAADSAGKWDAVPMEQL